MAEKLGGEKGVDLYYPVINQFAFSDSTSLYCFFYHNNAFILNLLCNNYQKNPILFLKIQTEHISTISCGIRNKSN